MKQSVGKSWDLGTFRPVELANTGHSSDPAKMTNPHEPLLHMYSTFINTDTNPENPMTTMSPNSGTTDLTKEFLTGCQIAWRCLLGAKTQQFQGLGHLLLFTQSIDDRNLALVSS